MGKGQEKLELHVEAKGAEKTAQDVGKVDAAQRRATKTGENYRARIGDG